MLVIIYSKLLILAVRQKDTKSYRPPLELVEPGGQNFPAGAGDHLRPKTKEGTFFLQKEGGFGAFSVS